MPYAPMTESRADVWLNKGISQAFESLAQGFEKHKEQQKRDKQEASSLRGLLEAYDPNNKDRYTAMGLNELRQEAARYAGQFEKQRKQMGDLAIAEAERRQAQDVAMGGFAGSVAGNQAMAGQGVWDQARSFNPAAGYQPPDMQKSIMAGLAAYPQAAAAPQFDNTLTALMKAYAPSRAAFGPSDVGTVFSQPGVPDYRFLINSPTSVTPLNVRSGMTGPVPEWVAVPDDKEFMDNLKKVKDPRDYEAILDRRVKIHRILGKDTSWLEAILTQRMGSGGANTGGAWDPWSLYQKEKP